MQAVAVAGRGGDELLSIETITLGERRVQAALLLAGQRELVDLGFEPPELLVFQRTPELLAYNDDLLRLVNDVLLRARAGEPIALPLDLSGAVRALNSHWPVPARHMAAPPDGRVAQVRRVSPDDPAPGLRTVHLEISHQRALVITDARDLPRGLVRFRFASGVHPWQLSPQERSAMADALVETLWIR